MKDPDRIILKGDKVIGRLFRWLMATTCDETEGRPILEGIHAEWEGENKLGPRTLVSSNGYAMNIFKPHSDAESILPGGTWKPVDKFGDKPFVTEMEPLEGTFPNYGDILPCLSAALDPQVSVTEVALNPKLLMQALKDIESPKVLFRIYSKDNRKEPSDMPIEMIGETDDGYRVVVLMPMHYRWGIETNLPPIFRVQRPFSSSKGES